MSERSRVLYSHAPQPRTVWTNQGLPASVTPLADLVCRSDRLGFAYKSLDTQNTIHVIMNPQWSRQSSKKEAQSIGTLSAPGLGLAPDLAPRTLPLPKEGGRQSIQHVAPLATLPPALAAAEPCVAPAHSGTLLVIHLGWGLLMLHPWPPTSTFGHEGNTGSIRSSLSILLRCRS